MNKFTPILIAGCLVSGAAAAVDHSLSATYKEQTADRLMANRTMADADTNGDGMLSEAEMMANMPEEWFIRFNHTQ